MQPAINHTNALNALMHSLDNKIDVVRQTLGVKPDLALAEERALAAGASLQSFIIIVSRLAMLTCRPTTSEVTDFIKDRVDMLNELATEVMMCKSVLAAAEARKRNPLTEN